MDENGRAGNGSLNIRPVVPESTGEGYPYAPENWPKEGDIWGWRTGRRVAPNGNFQDRYLYLPDRLNRRAENQGLSRKQHIFASKLSVERYIKANFPDADVDAFFASFTWRIPAVPLASTNGLFLCSIFQILFILILVFSFLDFICFTGYCIMVFLMGFNFN